MSDAIFELTDVSYAYQDVAAIDGLSLTVGQGERLVLLGANGSGKSTLLRLMDALIFADGGELKAFGETLSEEALGDEAANFAFRRRVGLVFQNPDVQLFNPTVFDELAFGPLQLGWPKEKIREKVAETLERFSIAHLGHRPPHRLSGGEKKRVALASVLILDPAVLLLDEPTAALDPASRSDMIRFLVECRGSGRTVVTATHEIDMVEDIADRAVVLTEGRVAKAGTPHEILGDFALLDHAHLTHVHWHSHGDGPPHAHHHLHR